MFEMYVSIEFLQLISLFSLLLFPSSGAQLPSSEQPEHRIFFF
jgi:hypothetical protein